MSKMIEPFMGTAMDCEHSWQGVQWTESGELQLPSTPYDECGDCGMKVWGGAIDAPPVKGLGYGK